MSSHLLDDDNDLVPQRERELTLSTGAILAIFVGLVLLCGLFFALGYNLHKPVQPIAAAPDSTTTADTTGSGSSEFSHFKPSAGSPANSAATAPAKTSGAKPEPEPAAAPEPTPAATAASTSAPPEPAAKPSPVPTHTAAPATRPQPPAATPQPAPAPAAAPAAAGAFLVQVAAVSHQDDANLLVGALKAKGYAVAARTEPQDKLFHIQIGPFATKKEAEAMRQRLLADGYNAIVK